MARQEPFELRKLCLLDDGKIEKAFDAGSGTDLLTLVRSLKFKSDGTASGTIHQGRESLGKHISAQVEQTIPEEVTLRVPVFKNAVSTVTIPCAVEIDPQSQTFKLTPYPGELHRGKVQAIESVVETLGEQSSEVPIYIGKP